LKRPYRNLENVDDAMVCGPSPTEILPGNTSVEGRVAVIPCLPHKKNVAKSQSSAA